MGSPDDGLQGTLAGPLEDCLPAFRQRIRRRGPKRPTDSMFQALRSFVSTAWTCGVFRNPGKRLSLAVQSPYNKDPYQTMEMLRFTCFLLVPPISLMIMAGVLDGGSFWFSGIGGG